MSEAVIPLLAMSALLCGGSGFLGYPLEWMLLASGVFAGFFAYRIGYSLSAMMAGIVRSVQTAFPALMIMLTVGLLIATWISAGTIPMMIYYGLHLVSPRYFLLTACLVCSAVSLSIGTSWGTIGTVGVALIGLAHALGVPMGAAAGAIVSGAYFGDKLSPLSDQTNLAPAVVGVNLFEHIRWLLWTTGPAWLLALSLYAIAGFNTRTNSPGDLDGLENALRSHFHFSLLLLGPPFIMVLCVIKKYPAVLGMLIASAVAASLAVVLQGQPASEVLFTALMGYKPLTQNVQADLLLARGGVFAFLHTIIVLLAAFVFAGIMVHCGLLSRILSSLLGDVYGRFSLISATVASSLLTGLMTGSSHLSVIVPGQLFQQAYRDANLAAKNLSRTTEDSGTVVVPLIPWSAAGVFVAKTLSVPTLAYLPWAVMNYTGFLFALLYAATGVGIAKGVLDPVDCGGPENQISNETNREYRFSAF